MRFDLHLKTAKRTWGLSFWARTQRVSWERVYWLRICLNYGTLPNTIVSRLNRQRHLRDDYSGIWVDNSCVNVFCCSALLVGNFLLSFEKGHFCSLRVPVAYSRYPNICNFYCARMWWYKTLSSALSRTFNRCKWCMYEITFSFDFSILDILLSSSTCHLAFLHRLFLVKNIAIPSNWCTASAKLAWALNSLLHASFDSVKQYLPLLTKQPWWGVCQDKCIKCHAIRDEACQSLKRPGRHSSSC